MSRAEIFETSPYDEHAAHFRRKWGWIVALGALFIIGGLFALFNALAATLVAIIYIAAAMVVAGVRRFSPPFRSGHGAAPSCGALSAH